MKYKVLSYLLSVSLLASPLCVYATTEYYGTIVNYSLNEAGEPEVKLRGTDEVIVEKGNPSEVLDRSTMILLETDGTGLAEEQITTDAVVQIMPYYGFDAWHMNEVSISPENPENAYLVELSDAVDNDEAYKMARRFVLESKSITDAYVVETLELGDLAVTNNICLKTTDGTEVTNTDFQELANAEIIYQESYDCYICKFPQDIRKEIQNANGGLWSAWYLYLEKICTALLKQYPDVFFSVGIEVSVVEAMAENAIESAVPIWQSAGDPNVDGEVTAEDAADLLITAAEIGTGASIKATSAEDVNADGFVSADDAAAVLCYAAAQGSGNPLSWLDILRK